MKFTTHGPLHIYFLYDPGHHSIYTLFKLAFCLCVFFLTKKTDKFKFLHTFSFSLSRIFQTRQCLRYYNCYILEDFQTIHKYTWCQMPSWPGSSTARRTAPGCTRPSRTTRPPEFRWGVVVPLPLDPPVPGSNPGPWVVWAAADRSVITVLCTIGPGWLYLNSGYSLCPPSVNIVTMWSLPFFTASITKSLK